MKGFKKWKATLASFYLLSCAKLAVAASDASDIFGGTAEKAEEVRDLLIGEIAVTIAAIVWIVFFLGMLMGKSSKDTFVKITIACVGIGATGAIVDFLMST